MSFSSWAKMGLEFSFPLRYENCHQLNRRNIFVLGWKKIIFGKFPSNHPVDISPNNTDCFFGGILCGNCTFCATNFCNILCAARDFFSVVNQLNRLFGRNWMAFEELFAFGLADNWMAFFSFSLMYKNHFIELNNFSSLLCPIPWRPRQFSFEVITD